MHKKYIKSATEMHKKCKKCIKSEKETKEKCIKSASKLLKETSEGLIFKKHIELNSKNTSSTAMLQAKGRPRPYTKASMPTRPK